MTATATTHYVYLETGPDSGVYRRRGAVGPNDEPESFAGYMARGGLRVFVANDDLGEQVTARVIRMVRATDPSVAIAFLGPLDEDGLTHPLVLQVLRRTKTPETGAFVEGAVSRKSWFMKLVEKFA